MSKGISGAIGMGTTAALSIAGFSSPASILGGLSTYLATRTIKHTQRAKGESSFQMANRVQKGNRAYNKRNK